MNLGSLTSSATVRMVVGIIFWLVKNAQAAPSSSSSLVRAGQHDPQPFFYHKQMGRHEEESEEIGKKILDTKMPQFESIAHHFIWGKHHGGPRVPEIGKGTTKCGTQQPPICGQCEELLDSLLPYLRENSLPFEVLAVISSPLFCTGAVVTANLPEDCIKVLTIFLPILQYIVQQKPNLNGKSICSTLLQPSGCCVGDDDPNMKWDLEVPPNPICKDDHDGDYKPCSGDHDGSECEKRNCGHGDEDTVTFIHMSDLHFDPLYKTGAVSNCEELLCCREGATVLTGQQVEEAGPWGNGLICDLPRITMDSALSFIAKYEANFIAWTGDSVPHDLDKETDETTYNTIKIVTDSIKEALKDKTVYPSCGNHDFHPPNTIAPRGKVPAEFDNSDTYLTLYDLWKPFIPKRNWKDFAKFKYAGYYSLKIADNLYLISLNTNLCYIYNLWTLFDVEDPGAQLKWLVSVLLQAEKEGAFVYIIGHISPSSRDCARFWSKNFFKILKRFSCLIKGQYYGHEHNDRMEIAYDDKGKLIGCAFMTPAVTTYGLPASTFRSFQVDSKCWNVLNHKTYTFNLTKANLNPTDFIQWTLSYSAKEEYELKDCTCKSLAGLVHQFKLDPNGADFSKYLGHLNKQDATLKPVFSTSDKESALLDLEWTFCNPKNC